MTKIQSMSENMAARALLAELHELREYRAKTESLLAQVAEQMEKGAKHISTMEKRLTMEREMTTALRHDNYVMNTAIQKTLECPIHCPCSRLLREELKP